MISPDETEEVEEKRKKGRKSKRKMKKKRKISIPSFVAKNVVFIFATNEAKRVSGC